MKVLIVAKTRQGSGACIGGIASDGRSVRLVPDDPSDERWGLAFNVGDVWEVEGGRPEALIPPHIENFVVHSRRFVKRISDPVPTILKFMPPLDGDPEGLYNGLVRARARGGLYVSEAEGIPPFSTMFWRPDRPLSRDTSGKRIRYRYSGKDREHSLVFVGFQEPVQEIPTGALLRVSLSHWWRPPDRPDDELRCFVQLSGWFESTVDASARMSGVSGLNAAGARLGVEVRTPLLEEARQAMARAFGYREFRSLQPQIISNVLNRRATFGVMPTGSGKSLCYQLPAIIMEGLTVVVSPLIALMQDQINHLREAGIPAVTLNSMLSHAEYVEGARRIRSGEAKLLYVAPETLMRPEVLVLLEESSLAILTIDEAHCISEWGHDFRPEYREVQKVVKRFSKATCLALTATATERVRDDVRTILGISKDDTFVAGFDRPNLFLDVRSRRRDGFEQILEFLSSRMDQSGIIYCSTRNKVDALAADLAREGVNALPYHAGMGDEDRRQNQRSFQLDEAEIMVATIAFGMGIDKPNIRFVIHATLPDCLETYYQQVGRAGRDGLRSDCMLLFGRQDMLTYSRIIDEGAESQRRGRVARLQEMARFAESQSCRRKSLLAYFGDPVPVAPCDMCDRCRTGTAALDAIDVSGDARLFLSCMQQCKQKFGRGHIVDVLRGSKSQKVLDWDHDLLQTYGTGKHNSADRWRLLADRFIDAGLIQAEMEHGTLRITEGGKRALAGEPVFVAIEEKQITARDSEVVAYDPALFEVLRALRLTIANEINMPPFVVFHDSSLIEMASKYLTSPGAFLKITGVGERKAAAYGERFLSAIRSYVEENGIDPASPPAGSLVQNLRPSRRRREIVGAFAEGNDIAAIQQTWGIQRSTVIQHLADYVRSGQPLDAARILAESSLPEEDRSRALGAFEELGHERLTPVFESMGGDAPYEELHLLRIYRLLIGRQDVTADL